LFILTNSSSGCQAGTSAIDIGSSGFTEVLLAFCDGFFFASRSFDFDFAFSLLSSC
jgi:hypothetical protein